MVKSKYVFRVLYSNTLVNISNFYFDIDIEENTTVDVDGIAISR